MWLINKRTYNAFSLIEILMSLIIVSLVMGSFAPVITKKITTSKVVQVKVTTKCDHIDTDCAICKKDTCYSCAKTCVAPKYKINSTCKCGDCTDLSEGCITCTSMKCKSCMAGYYLSADGICIPCTTIDSGKTPVTYQNLEGQTKCIICPEAHKCENAISTEPCSYGYGANQGAGVCTQCSVAMSNCIECSNTTQCEKCEIGFYVDPDEKICKQCEPDHRCPDGITRYSCDEKNGSNEKASACTLCSLAIDFCDECENLTECLTCQEGYYLLEDGSCQQCPAGYSCESLPIQPCPGGTVSPAGQLTCEVCPSGKSPNATKSACVSASCDPGYYLNGSCYKCEEDHYCDGTTKYPCDSGYGANAGASKCTLCSTAIIGCGECSNLSVCTSSAPGYYISYAGAAPVACPKGHYCVAGSTAPVPCAQNYYQDKMAQSSCIACPDGAKTTGTGAESSSQCILCVGQNYINEDGVCASCSKFGSSCTKCNDEIGCLPDGCVVEGNIIYARESLDAPYFYCQRCLDFYCHCTRCSVDSSNIARCQDCYEGRKHSCSPSGCSCLCETCQDGYTLKNGECEKN